MIGYEPPAYVKQLLCSDFFLDPAFFLGEVYGALDPRKRRKVSTAVRLHYLLFMRQQKT